MARRAGKTLTVLSVGHSTRDLDTFIRLLQAHAVARIVDVRSIPKSRHNPQFNKETLPAALSSGGISYLHMAALGGRRHALRDSPNGAWRNASFRGFSDHMQTPTFDEGLQTLIEMAHEDRLALMCAEAVPWRCHRSLIADALVARGIQVEHVLNESRAQAHVMTPFARVRGKHVVYPAEGADTAAFAPPKGVEMTKRKPTIELARAYDPPPRDKDRFRVLVDRLWPRGVKKADLEIDAWMKELAPSSQLRRWFNHDPKRWDEFRERYFKELDELADRVSELLASADGRTILLLYGARDEAHNQAVALKQWIENHPSKLKS